MKVMIAATSSENYSGASKAFLELCQSLKAESIDVIAMIPSHGQIEESLKKLNIKYYYAHEYHCWYTGKQFQNNKFKLKRLLNNLTIAKLICILRKEKPDVVHINALTAYTVGVAAEKCHIPVVWHIREFMEEDLKIEFYDKKFSYNILKKATCLVAISKATKKKWENELKREVKLIYDGLPVERYLVKHKEYMKEKTIRIILYGRITPTKGQILLLKAISGISSKPHNQKVLFYFAGKVDDVDYFEKCKQYVKLNNLEKKVNYLGEVMDIKNLLADKDIVCVCSSNEAFGRVTVEGMLSKCLVVASDSGASGELIQDGITGRLYRNDSVDSLTETILKAINDLYINNGIPDAAQTFAINNFSEQSNTENIIKLYKKII